MKGRTPRRRSSLAIPLRKLRRGDDKKSPMKAALLAASGAFSKVEPLPVMGPVPAMKDPMRTLGHPPRGRKRGRRR